MNRNKGDEIRFWVPRGRKVEIVAIAKQRELLLTDYLKMLITNDTGLDLSVEMGNPYLVKHGTLNCHHFDMERIGEFPCDSHPRGCIRWRCRDCGYEKVVIKVGN